MDGREREHDRPRDFGTELFGDFGEPVHLVDVEEDVIDPDAAAAVAAELPHPRIHQRIRRYAEGDGSVRPHAAANSRARHSGNEKVKALPRILAAGADHHFKKRGPCQIDDSKTATIDEWRDWQRHAGLHAHAPEALLAVAHRLVEEFDMGHVRPPLARDIGAGTRLPATVCRGDWR